MDKLSSKDLSKESYRLFLLGEALAKIDEIVEWINEQEKQLHKPIPVSFYKRGKGLKLLKQNEERKGA